jgi:hypothetical protein
MSRQNPEVFICPSHGAQRVLEGTICGGLHLLRCYCCVEWIEDFSPPDDWYEREAHRMKERAPA